MGVSKKEVERIFDTLSSARKPSQALVYLGIFAAALVAGFVAVNMHTGSMLISAARFSFVFLMISLFISVFHVAVHKTNIMSGLSVVNGLIDSMSLGKWEYQFPTKNIHPLIRMHPVFKTIAGLYVYHAAEDDRGLALIEKAASELPSVHACIKNGQVTSVPKFRALANNIFADLQPSTTFVAAFRLLQVAGLYLIVIITAAIVFAALLDFLKK